MDITVLPHFHASCNAITTVLLLAGFYFIKQGKKDHHKACMVSALVVSALFLASYLTYHYFVGTFKFAGQGPVRVLYFFILTTHTVLAIAALPMIVMTIYRAVKENFEAHKKIARYTLPVWLYVSVTGVLVYWLLYHIYPGGY